MMDFRILLKPEENSLSVYIRNLTQLLQIEEES